MSTFHSHTLHSLDDYVSKSKGSVPRTYASFCKLFSSMPAVREEGAAVELVPTPAGVDGDEAYGVPTLEEMGFPPIQPPLKVEPPPPIFFFLHSLSSRGAFIRFSSSFTASRPNRRGRNAVPCITRSTASDAPDSDPAHPP